MVLAFELILSTVIIILIISSFLLSLSLILISSHLNTGFLSIPLSSILIITLSPYFSSRFTISIISALILSIITLISILVESNRQLFDLSEAELELIAGFLTDFSSTLYLLPLLTEYAQIIFLVIIFLVLLLLILLISITILILISLSRSLFSRFRYDLLLYYC